MVLALAGRAEPGRLVDAARRGQAVLSPERDLLIARRLVAQGAGNREAAARLFISEATVKTHLMHIYAKLGVNDRAAAVAAAFDRGLLTPGVR